MKLLLLVSAVVGSLAKEALLGQQVLNLYPSTAEHVDFVQRLKRDASHRVTLIAEKEDVGNSFSQMDFWSAPSRPGKTATVRLDARDATRLVRQARGLGLQARIVHRDMRDLIQRDFSDHVSEPQEQFQKNGDWRDFDMGRYHTHEEMNNFVVSLAKTFTNISRLVKYGSSYEGHPMFGLVIGGNSSADSNGVRRRLFLDAGLHAREWAAPAVALYTLRRLLTSEAAEDVALRDGLEWHVLPNANPDGYIYSMAAPDNRYWRKTRTPQGCADLDGRGDCDCTARPETCCFGVDPNRNWDFAWGHKGASADPCSDIFKGNTSSSEPEVRAIARYLTNLGNGLKGYVSLHSFSDLWLVPFGYDTTAFPADFDDLISVAREGVAAVNAVHGSNYTAEHSAGLYPAAGASDDWVKGVLGVPWVYTLELRPHPDQPEANTDDGYGGFALPKEQIIPTGEEIFEGLRVLAKRIMRA